MATEPCFRDGCKEVFSALSKLKDRTCQICFLSYCSPHCMALDDLHPRLCRSTSMKDVRIDQSMFLKKGQKGLLTLVDRKAGDVILTEDPLILLPVIEPSEIPEHMREAYDHYYCLSRPDTDSLRVSVVPENIICPGLEKYDRMADYLTVLLGTEDRIDKFGKSMYLNPENRAEKIREVLLNIVRQNGFGMSGIWTNGPLQVCMYRCGSFLNHSCEPNAWLHSLGPRLCAVARKDMAAGEEVTISYHGESSLGPRKERRSEIMAQYGFLCRCSVCENDGQVLNRVPIHLHDGEERLRVLIEHSCLMLEEGKNVAQARLETELDEIGGTMGQSDPRAVGRLVTKWWRRLWHIVRAKPWTQREFKVAITVMEMLRQIGIRFGSKEIKMSGPSVASVTRTSGPNGPVHFVDPPFSQQSAAAVMRFSIRMMNIDSDVGMNRQMKEVDTVAVLSDIKKDVHVARSIQDFKDIFANLLPEGYLPRYILFPDILNVSPMIRNFYEVCKLFDI